MHKNQKTSESFAAEIKEKFNLTLITEYTGAKNKCIVQGVCGHQWEVIPSNLLFKGNRKECRECAGLSKEYVKWTEDNINKLKEGIARNLSIEELAKIFNTSIHAINKTVEVYGLSRKDFRLIRDTLPKLNEMLDIRGYKLLTDSIDSSQQEITYLCDKGHTHTQLVQNFLKGHGCKICANELTSSKGELELYTYISSIMPENTWIEQRDRKILSGGLELDIVLPDLGVAFEYGGNYHHSEERGKYPTYHLNKLLEVEAFEYRLVSITDEEWLKKNSIVKSRINTILGLNTTEYARKCTLREISYDACAEFCINNHIQGEAKTSVNLGLFLHDELVAIMSFSKARYSEAYEYELVRYCSKLNLSVVGGASKLLKYFENKYTPKSIGSYSDRRWNTGKLYLNLGFQRIHDTPPNYRYYKGGSSYSRQKFMKHTLEKQFPDIFLEEKTEKEIMSEAGYLRVYDCGSTLFIKRYE